jgi:hypothetical protein
VSPKAEVTVHIADLPEVANTISSMRRSARSALVILRAAAKCGCQACLTYAVSEAIADLERLDT